jgi:hypothetical protein
MTTKPPLQKILHGILHPENESKQNHERSGRTNHRRRKDKESESNINLNALHTIKPLNNKTTK